MAEFRIEKDTLGEIQVPDDKYWGAQTQRSIENFAIGGHRMPQGIIRAFAQLKKASALVNKELTDFPEEKADAIAAACDEILAGIHEDPNPSTHGFWWEIRLELSSNNTAVTIKNIG